MSDEERIERLRADAARNLDDDHTVEADLGDVRAMLRAIDAAHITIRDLVFIGDAVVDHEFGNPYAQPEETKAAIRAFIAALPPTYGSDEAGPQHWGIVAERAKKDYGL